jgi:anthranilate phosphoribosyltransferase
MRLSQDEMRARLLSLTPEEIEPALFKRLLAGMRDQAIPLPELKTPVLDCCGTGGSGLPRFNVSTTCAFILAAGGVPVVKFGNRAASSRSGSFDLLEALGIPDHWSLDALPEILNEAGLVFLYAPQVYPQFKDFSILRKSLGTRTVFNFMGPLLNPVNPAYRVLGVSHARMQGLMADVLCEDPHTQRAWVLRADSGLDELSPGETNKILEVENFSIQERRYRPNPPLNPVDAALQHTTDENRAIFQAIVSGDDARSVYYRITCLNAGAGFSVAGQTTTLEEGVTLAEDLLAGKKVAEQMERVRRIYDPLR